MANQIPASVVQTKCSTPGEVRVDKTQSATLEKSLSVSHGCIKVSKAIFAKNELLKRARAIGVDLDREIKKIALPWIYQGSRLIPNSKLQEFSDMFDTYETRFLDIANRFIKEYPAIVENAKKRLGNSAKDSDYPSVDEIKRQFAFERTISPIPDVSNDPLIGVKGSLRKQIKADAIKTQKEAFSSAAKAILVRVRISLENFSESVGSYEVDDDTGKVLKRFRQEALDNVEASIVAAEELNVFNDKDIAKVCRELRKDFVGLKSEALRSDEWLREDKVEKANTAIQKIHRLSI